MSGEIPWQKSRDKVSWPASRVSKWTLHQSSYKVRKLSNQKLEDYRELDQIRSYQLIAKNVKYIHVLSELQSQVNSSGLTKSISRRCPKYRVNRGWKAASPPTTKTPTPPKLIVLFTGLASSFQNPGAHPPLFKCIWLREARVGRGGGAL